MKELGGAVLVGLGGLGVLGGLFSVVGGLIATDGQDGKVTNAARGAFVVTGLVSGAIGAAMVYGGMALIKQ